MTTNPQWVRIQVGTFLSGCALLASLGSAVENNSTQYLGLEVTVNGISRTVKKGEVLNLVRGDLVVLEKAKTWPEGEGADCINFLGFRNSWKGKNSEDDSYQKIDTTQLKKGWTKDGQAENYSILVKRNRKTIGEVAAVLKNPRLLSVEVVINGIKTVIEDRGVINIGHSDDIQVVRVLSSDKSVDEKLSVVMDGIDSLGEGSTTEMKIFHGTYHLGSVFFQGRK